MSICQTARGSLRLRLSFLSLYRLLLAFAACWVPLWSGVAYADFPPVERFGAGVGGFCVSHGALVAHATCDTFAPRVAACQALVDATNAIAEAAPPGSSCGPGTLADCNVNPPTVNVNIFVEAVFPAIPLTCHVGVFEEGFTSSTGSSCPSNSTLVADNSCRCTPPFLESDGISCGG